MARKDITMTAVEMDAFLESGTTLQVATLDRRGWPHLAPMWYFVDNGKVTFRSFTKSQKIVNLQRDRRLTVLLEDGTAYAELRGLMIRGEARLMTDRGAVLESYRRLAAKYPMLGDQPRALDDTELEEAFGRFADKNTVVVVEPTKISSWDHHKIGGGY